MEKAGLINVYVCPGCGWRAITRNRDAGTTPFIIRCENECAAGDELVGAQSSIYRVDQHLEPTHEWYKPLSALERDYEPLIKEVADRRLKHDGQSMTNLERLGMLNGIIDHVANGGLLLRKLQVH